MKWLCSALIFVLSLTIEINYSIGLHIKSSRILKSISSSLIIISSLVSTPSYSIDWTDRNRLAAETWRTIDDLYYDRTFNGIDWFQARQKLVKHSYSTDEELYSAIKDMIALLGDKYTRFLPPAQYNVLVNSAVGELTGVGVQLLNSPDGRSVITAIEENSPAATSGLARGDVIINIDGVDTLGLSPEEVAALIRGKQDSKARIRIRRDSSNEVIDVVIVRKPFKLTGVTSNVIKINNKSIGMIKLKSFSSTTSTDVFNALQSLHNQGIGDKGDKYSDTIILDLRGNGGGVLQAAVDTANAFLPPGKIITFVVNKDGLSDALRTLPGAITTDSSDLPDLTTKLFILVDKDTASAAEVLTAGLKDNDRATIIGERTFGKGVIQTLQQLSQGGIAVTIAKYETPKHTNINKVGIPVDIEVNCKDDNLKVCLEPIL